MAQDATNNDEALRLAISKGRRKFVEVVRLLFNHGASVDDAMLQLARELNHVEVVQLLLDRGAV